MDLLYLSAPASVTMGFTFSMSVIPLAFIGNYLGVSQLNGASIGYFITCIIVLYPMMGMTFAMDTLCSHEYGRDRLSGEMGLILQRGVLINFLILTPLCIAIYYLTPFLTLLYGASVAEIAQDFLTYAPLYFAPFMLFIALTKFCNNQMQAHLPTIALTAGVILTPFLQLKFTPMGVRYTMIAMAISA
uniref:Putative transporter C11D3.06 n=1 Tax=Lygus hesperus TaxID=30085 RepID=A0A0A9W5U8_LYGHE